MSRMHCLILKGIYINTKLLDISNIYIRFRLIYLPFILLKYYLFDITLFISFDCANSKNEKIAMPLYFKLKSCFIKNVRMICYTLHAFIARLFNDTLPVWYFSLFIQPNRRVILLMNGIRNMYKRFSRQTKRNNVRLLCY